MLYGAPSGDQLWAGQTHTELPATMGAPTDFLRPIVPLVLTDGFSGGPWLADLNPITGEGQLVAVSKGMNRFRGRGTWADGSFLGRAAEGLYRRYADVTGSAESVEPLPTGAGMSGRVLSAEDVTYFDRLRRQLKWRPSTRPTAGRLWWRRSGGSSARADRALEFVRFVVRPEHRVAVDASLPGFAIYQAVVNGTSVVVRARSAPAGLLFAERATEQDATAATGPALAAESALESGQRIAGLLAGPAESVAGPSASGPAVVGGPEVGGTRSRIGRWLSRVRGWREVRLSGAGVGVRLFRRGGVWHLWAGIDPSQAVMEGVEAGAGTVVVHAHGVDGGVGFADGVAVGVAAAKAGEAKNGGASLAVLLACEQSQAAAFRDTHGIDVAASDASVFVNELDGSVFVGRGVVDADGKLTAAVAAEPAFWLYPRDGSPRVPYAGAPFTVLTAAEAMARPGRWVQRLGVGRWVAALAGLAGLVSAAPAGGSGRRVGMVVRDWHEGVSELPTHGATDVVVGGFQYRLNTTNPYGGNDTNDYVHGLDPVLLLNGVPVDDSRRDPVLRDVAGLAGVNRIAMLGGSSNYSSGYSDLGDDYLPPSAWDVTFSQLYPPMRHMLRMHSFTGLNLFPSDLRSNAFNYSRLIDAVRADFGREFMVALTWSGNVGDGYSADWGRQVREVKDKVDWHVLYGDRWGGGWAGFLQAEGLDPSRVLVLVDTGDRFTPGPSAEVFDSEDSISAGIGALVGGVPDLLGVVGWDFANAQLADSPWLWTQYAGRALVEGDYLPGELARQRRVRGAGAGVGAVVGVVVVGGSVYVLVTRVRRRLAWRASRAQGEQRRGWYAGAGDVELVEFASRSVESGRALEILQDAVDGLEEATWAMLAEPAVEGVRARRRRARLLAAVPVASRPRRHVTGGASGLLAQLARTRRDLEIFSRLRPAVVAGEFGVQQWALLKAYREGELDRDAARSAAMQRLRRDFPGLAAATDGQVGAVLESVVDHILQGTDLVTNLDLDQTVTFELDRPLWLPDAFGGHAAGTRATVRELLQGGQPGGVFPAGQTRVTVTVWEFMRAVPQVGALLNNWITESRTGRRYVEMRGRKESELGYLPALLPRGDGASMRGDSFRPEEPWTLPSYMSLNSVLRPSGTHSDYGRVVFHWNRAKLRGAVTYRENGLLWTGSPTRWENNPYWLPARGAWQVIHLMVGEATGFEQAQGQLGALSSEPDPPPTNEMLEAYLHRPAGWDDVERVVLNWSPGAADGLARASRLAEELEAFADENGFDFKVVLHRDGDAPLLLFRYPRAFVRVPGSTQVPATSVSLVRGEVTVSGAQVSASLAAPEAAEGEVVLEVSVASGVGWVDAHGGLVLPARDWSKVVVQGLLQPQRLMRSGRLDRSVAGRLSDFDGRSLPRDTWFGPADADGVRVGVSGVVAGRSWRLVPVDSRDEGVDMVLDAQLFGLFEVGVVDAVLVVGVQDGAAAYLVAVEVREGTVELDPGQLVAGGLSGPAAGWLDGVVTGVGADLLVNGGVVTRSVAADGAGVVRLPAKRAMPLLALGRRALLGGVEDAPGVVDGLWAVVVAAMTPVQWFAATRKVWAKPDAAIREVVASHMTPPRMGQVLSDKLVERKRSLPLPRVWLAQLRAAGLAPAPEVAGVVVVETPLGWHVSADGAVPSDVAFAVPKVPGDFRVTVDPVEVAAGRITEEQIAAVFAGLAAGVAQFTSLDPRASSGALTKQDMAEWAVKVSGWAAARGEPVGSYHPDATAAVTAPRMLFDVLPTENEAFAVGVGGDLATATFAEFAVEFRFWLPGRLQTYLPAVGAGPSLERHGYEDGGQLLPQTGVWAAKQLKHGLLVYQPPLPFAPPATSTELSGVVLAGDGSGIEDLPRGVPRVLFITAKPDPVVVDLSRWTRVGEQLGGKPGGTYQSPEGGRYYVKEVASREVAATQVLGSGLYNFAGVNATPVGLGTGTPGLASEVQIFTRFVPGPTPPVKTGSTPPGLPGDDVFVRKVHSGFAVVAWLGHRDSNYFYNIARDEAGEPWLFDMGGVLQFGALGGLKTYGFDDTVPELDIMRGEGGIYSGMSEAEVAESAKLLQPFTPELIDEFVAAAGVEAWVAERLQRRRAYILNRYGPESGPAADQRSPLARLPKVLSAWLGRVTAGLAAQPRVFVSHLQPETASTLLADGRVSTPVELAAGGGVTVAGHVVRGVGSVEATVLVLGERSRQLRSEGVPAGIDATLLVVVGSTESGDQVVVGKDMVMGGAQLAALLLGAPTVYRLGQPVQMLVDGGLLGEAVLDDLARALSVSVTQRSLTGGGDSRAAGGSAAPTGAAETVGVSAAQPLAGTAESGGRVGAVDAVVDEDLAAMVRLLPGRSGPVTPADLRRLAGEVGVAEESALVGVMSFARTLLERRPNNLAELVNVGRVGDLVGREVPGEARRGLSVEGLELWVAGVQGVTLYPVRSTLGDRERIVAGAGRAAGSQPGGAITSASMAAALGPDFMLERQRRLREGVTGLDNRVLWVPDPAVASDDATLGVARTHAAGRAAGSGLVVAVYVSGELGRPSWDGQDLLAHEIAWLTVRLRRDGTWNGRGTLSLLMYSAQRHVTPVEFTVPWALIRWRTVDDLYLAQSVVAGYQGRERPVERLRWRVVSLHGQTMVWGRVGGLPVLVAAPGGHVLQSKPTALVLFREGDSPPQDVARPRDPSDLRRGRVMAWRVDTDVALGWLTRLGDPGREAILDIRGVESMTAQAALGIAGDRGIGSGPVALPREALTGELSNAVARHLVGVGEGGEATVALLTVREYHVYADANDALARLLQDQNLPDATVPGFTAVKDQVRAWAPFHNEYVVDRRSVVVFWVHHREVPLWVKPDLGPFGKSNELTVIVGQRGRKVPELLATTVWAKLRLTGRDTRFVVHGPELVAAQEELLVGQVNAERLAGWVVLVWSAEVDADTVRAHRAAAAALSAGRDEVVVYVVPEIDDDAVVHAVDQVLARVPRSKKTVRLVVAAQWANYPWAARYTAMTVTVDRLTGGGLATTSGATTSGATTSGATTSGATRDLRLTPGDSAVVDVTAQRAAGSLAAAAGVTATAATPGRGLWAERRAAVRELGVRLAAEDAKARPVRLALEAEATRGYHGELALLQGLLVERVDAGNGTLEFYQVVFDTFPEQVQTKLGGQSPSVALIQNWVLSKLVTDFQAYDDDPVPSKKATTHPYIDVLRRYGVDVDELDEREEYLRHASAAQGRWNPDDAKHMIHVLARMFEWAATLLLPDRAHHVGDPATEPMAYLYSEDAMLRRMRQPDGGQVRRAADLWQVAPITVNQEWLNDAMTLIVDYSQLTGADYQQAKAEASNQDQFVRKVQPLIRRFGDQLDAVEDQPTLTLLVRLLNTYGLLVDRIHPPTPTGAKHRNARRVVTGQAVASKSTPRPAQPRAGQPPRTGRATLLADGRVTTPIELMAGAGVGVAGQVVRRVGSVEATVLVLVSGRRFGQLRSQGLPAGIEGKLGVVVGSIESGDQVVVGEDKVMGGADLGALLSAAGTVYRPGQAVALFVDGGPLGQAVLTDLRGALPASVSVTQQSLRSWGKSPAAAGPVEPFVQVPLSGAGDRVWLFHRGGVWHVWAGINPSQAVMQGVRVGAGTVVVHAHGADGGLGEFADGVAVAVGMAKAGEPGAGEAKKGGASLAVLLACAQTSGRGV